MVPFPKTLSQWTTRLFGGSSFATACYVFVAALVFQIVGFAKYYDAPEMAATGLSILGTPFTDARGWHVLGRSLAEGQGMTAVWPALRPGYGLFLALFYTWGPESHLLAVALNLILAALTAALVCRIGERLLDRWVGILAALAFLIQKTTIEMPLTIATEPLGLFCSMFSLHLFLRGLDEESRLPMLSAGIFMGISNLVRPMTLPALPVLLLISTIGLTRTRGFRCALDRSAGFVGGMALVIAPWLLRQWLAFGLVTISNNTADALYAATSPEYGSWTGQVKREPELRNLTTIKQRHDYYMDKAKANLRANPGYYVTNVAESYLRCVENVSASIRARLLAVGAAAIVGSCLLNAGRLRGSRRTGLCLAAFGLATGAYVYCGRTFGVSLDAAAFVVLPFVCRRMPSIVVIALSSLTTFGIAMFGMHGADPRMLYMVQWGFILVHVAAVGGTCHRLLDVFALPDRNSLDRLAPLGATPAPRWFASLLGVLVVCALVSAIRLAILNSSTVVPEPDPKYLTSEQAAQTVRDFSARYPGLLRADDLQPSRIFGSPSAERQSDFTSASFAGLFDHRPDESILVLDVKLFEPRYRLPKDVNLNHWSHNFAPRSYDRTVCYFQFDGIAYPKYFCYNVPAIFPGDVPSRFFERPSTMLIRVRHDPKGKEFNEDVFFEGIALVPRDDDGTLRYDDAYVADHPDHAPRALVGWVERSAAHRKVR